MTKPTIALVTTTIYVPKALDAYMRNIVTHGHAERSVIIVAGDKKTPKECGEFLEAAARKHGVRTIYMDPDQQDEFLESCGYTSLKASLPWNCIQRRNVAMLRAFETGAEVIVTIDDDNLAIEGQDFLGEHAGKILGSRLWGPDGCPGSARGTIPAGDTYEMDTLESTSGWHNVCESLVERRGYEFYHRGYPMEQRWVEPKPLAMERREQFATFAEGDGDGSRDPAGRRRVAVNAGLWLGDPDVDAHARLCLSLEATGLKRTTPFALSRGTWSPFNSQNTSLHRSVLHLYHVSWRIGRHDDIWPSYVVRLAADALGHAVSYGFPVVNQERNPHDYFRDHELEADGLRLVGKLCERLRLLCAGGGADGDGGGERTYRSIGLQVEQCLREWDCEFAHRLAETMAVWRETMDNAAAREAEGKLLG